MTNDRIEDDPTDRGLVRIEPLPRPPTALRPAPVPAPVSQPVTDWSTTDARLISEALTMLWNQTVSRQRSSMELEATIEGYMDALAKHPADCVLEAIAVWPGLKDGKWWPTLHDLMAVVYDYDLAETPSTDPPERLTAPRDPSQRARVQAGFNVALGHIRPGRTKLADRKRPPPRYLTGTHLSESRKKAAERLADYGAQGGE